MRARRESFDDDIPSPATVFEPKEMSNLDSLDDEHASIFRAALTRLLGTELAEHTFAEIVDGLPTKASFSAFHRYFNTTNHPVFALDHTELCPGVIEKTRQIRDEFDPMSLTFKTELLSAFQRALPSTQRFELRLLEMLADACHQIASYLYSLDNGVHKHSLYYAWRDSTEPASPDPRLVLHRAPAAFNHTAYQDFDQYPNGISDVAGYWAEAKIFGGVMVFDRGESGTECRDVYLHSCSVNGPATLYPPTPQQSDALISFLLGTATQDAPCPLPIPATSENRATDWPEIGDEMVYAVKQYREAQGEEPFDQAEKDRLEENMKKITPSSPLWRG
ncbi:hypothetical protein QBC34DRAFT_488060 [Podospora aff. communis PSN243]|uniref:Uncharacterized protein n=1 Tax=Podospora aff. communis PSN243 TaxID=3040156 RepID=A0AAV9G784_9PEZI|nr:hypothetical protein QBC34DRAFT_488060 [Podospora aff. communis PSN243]